MHTDCSYYIILSFILQLNCLKGLSVSTDSNFLLSLVSWVHSTSGFCPQPYTKTAVVEFSNASTLLNPMANSQSSSWAVNSIWHSCSLQILETHFFTCLWRQHIFLFWGFVFLYWMFFPSLVFPPLPLSSCLILECPRTPVLHLFSLIPTLVVTSSSLMA